MADSTENGSGESVKDTGAKDEESVDLSDALARSIGGNRGILDSSIPTAVFVVAYIATSSNLTFSVWAAVAAGVVVAIIRIVRGETLRQVIMGFVIVAISAVLAARTGRAQDFFLIGILINFFWSLGFAISALVGRPLIGYFTAAFTGRQLSMWHKEEAFLKACSKATWVWAGFFLLRLVVQVPLFMAGAVGALGAAKLAMGWPLTFLAGFISYKLLAPVLKPKHDDPPDSSQSDSGQSEDQPETDQQAGLTEKPGDR